MWWQKLKNQYHLFIAILAVIRYGYPAKKLTVIGVTGTDGKTTTANMIYQVLSQAGKNVGLVSTVGAKIGSETIDVGLHVTTPSSVQLQKLLRKMVKDGCQYAVIEATSHGLDQNRLYGCNFKYGVLTNITHEHLDYHKTFANYVRAKAKLFRHVAVAILNNDGIWEKEIQNYFTPKKIVTVGLSETAQINPAIFSLNLKLSGDYNLANAMAAVAVGKEVGVDDEKIRTALESFTGIVGRMDAVDCGQPFQVIVDFAHTPNASEQVLKTLVGDTKGRLITVFGSAGLRDVTKRPLTGSVVVAYSHLAIVTADDPATEDLDKIISQIVPGCEKSGAQFISQDELLKGNHDVDSKYYTIEKDRRKAIELAIKIAKPGDTVALLGKGHQKSFSLGTKEIPWDEKQVAIDALKAVGYGGNHG